MIKLRLQDDTIPPDIQEQLALLLETPVGTVVLDRDFGIDMSFVDMPVNMAKNLAAVEFARKIKRYIPGIRLKEVREGPSSPESGTIELRVVVELAE